MLVVRNIMIVVFLGQILSFSRLLGQDKICAIKEVIKVVENDYPGFEFLKKSKQFDLYKKRRVEYLKCTHVNKLHCELNIFKYITQFQDAHFLHYINDDVNKLKLSSIEDPESHKSLLGIWKYLPEDNVFVTIAVNQNRNLIGYTTVKYEDKVRRDTFLTFVPTKSKTEYVLITRIDSNSYYYSTIDVTNNFLFKNRRKTYKRVDKINFEGVYKQNDEPNLF